MTETPGALEQLIQTIPENTLPPVNDWHPPVTRSIDMLIARNGDWFYEGSRIDRARMVKLFSTVLRADDDGHTYLVTPQERLKITVEDAQFTAVLVEQQGAPDARTLVFTTNVGERVVADTKHPISVSYKSKDGEPSPYIVVRDRLRALISRAAFYQMVDWAEERDGVIGVESAGHFMPLSDSASP